MGIQWFILYLSQRGRPDIWTAISFLCGRLHNPDVDNYKKLTRMIRYLRGTKSLVLTLRANDDGIIRWWIDASYAVHDDMKGHTGATMSLGKRGIYSGSWKQRLVARSSTKSELIGIYDTLPQVLWTKQFLEEQGWRDSNCHHCLPRQHQFNPAGKKWMKFKYEADKAHEHKILLCYRASQEQGCSCNALPHRGNGRRFLYEAVAGFTFH